MGHNLELKGKSEAALEVLVKKENIPDPPFSGQKVLQSGTNYKGNAYDKEASRIEQTLLSSRNEDMEVNITGCTNSSKALMEEDTSEDATECSSSFGDTGSGSENGSPFSDDEVMSQMDATDAFSSMFWCEPSLIRYVSVWIISCIYFFLSCLWEAEKQKLEEKKKELYIISFYMYLFWIIHMHLEAHYFWLLIKPNIKEEKGLVCLTVVLSV